MERRRLSRNERRAQLLTAAAAAFLRGGFEATSMEDVAREAGVTRLIVYRNFDTKAALYRAVLQSVIDALSDLVGEAKPPDIAPLVLAVARDQPDGFRLLWRHAAREPEFAALANGFRTFVNAYADALIHPQIHDRTLRVWAASAIAAHLYDGICLWLDTGDPARDAEFAARLAGGLRALVTAWANGNS
jgi:AcrR family transcriptional regulator